MDSYVKAITLDVNADENYTIIKAKQGDKINRKIAITLKKDGANFTPTGVSQIWFRVQKPDKNIAIVKSTDSGNPISSAGNVYTVTLSEQCLTASGKAWCDLAFLDSSGNTLSSCAFILNIIPMPNGNTARSISEWTDLQQAIDDAERFASIVAFRTSGNYIQYTVDGTTWVNLTTVGAIGGDLQTQINALNSELNSNGKNPFAGKKVGFWGDSVMYGLLQDNSQSAYNYPTVFGQLTGADIENNAVSGMSITASNSSFLDVYQTVTWTNYDYAVLGFGENDIGQGKTIDAIKTAFNTVLGYIMTANPSIKVTLVSVTTKNNIYAKWSPSNIRVYDVYCIVRDVAKAHKISFIDLLFGSSINQYNLATLSWDGGSHYTDAGYKVIGEFLAQRMLGETIHDIIDFGAKAEKIRVLNWGGSSGAEIYIYGSDESIYAVQYLANAVSLNISYDNGATWTNAWLVNPPLSSEKFDAFYAQLNYWTNPTTFFVTVPAAKLKSGTVSVNSVGFRVQQLDGTTVDTAALTPTAITRPSPEQVLLHYSIPSTLTQNVFGTCCPLADMTITVT